MSASSAVIHLHHRRREELVEVIADDQIVEQKQQPSDDREDRNPQPNNSDSDNNNNAAAASSPAQSQAQTPIMHIVLNVGGMRYETSSETIRRIPYTRLTRLLDENADGSGGEIFIDRCGALFHLVLNFLRSGTIASEVVDKDPEIIDRLEKEAQVNRLRRQLWFNLALANLPFGKLFPSFATHFLPKSVSVTKFEYLL